MEGTFVEIDDYIKWYIAVLALNIFPLAIFGHLHANIPAWAGMVLSPEVVMETSLYRSKQWMKIKTQMISHW